MVLMTTKRPWWTMGGANNRDGKTASLSQAHTLAAAGSDPSGSGAMSLVVYHRDGAEAATLRAGEQLVLGRVGPADLVVPDRSLSRQHARFWIEDGAVHVEDLGSTNGTWIDGESIERAAIRPGQIVTLGTTSAVIQSLAHRPRMGLDGHDHFVAALDDELVRARFHSRQLSLMMIRPRAPGSHVSSWVDRVRAAVRPVDRVALYSADTVELLLHEAGAEQAVALARTLMSDDEHGLALAICTFPGAATTSHSLVDRCLQQLRNAVQKGEVCVASSTGATPVDEGGSSRIIAESKAMRDTLTMARRLARGHIPVLLQGETGTGKEVLSRYIHDQGPRAGQAMIAVNCAAIPPHLVESTLFGHEKGAFTGATAVRKGVFEAADGGTVLLDEIGELPSDAQAALLRVLETRTITRVGATKEIAVDVRIMAATHRDLDEMSRTGAFREDLLYRLNAFVLEIPPLRERREEIPALARHFLAQANASNGRAITDLAPDTLAALRRYPWPGNIRELRNIIERAVVIAEHDLITLADLSRRIEDNAARAEPDSESSEEAPPSADREILRHTAETFRACMERLEANVIVEALEEAHGNQTEAARLLDMPRRTLVHKIKVLGIKKLGWGAN